MEKVFGYMIMAGVAMGVMVNVADLIAKMSADFCTVLHLG